MTNPRDLFTRDEVALLEGRAEAIAGELLAERQRQMSEEGWSLKHDETHAPAELAAAGAAYAASAAAGVLVFPKTMWSATEFRRWIVERLWPWFADGFKPKDPRRDLVRAGALIIAAIERLDREDILHADVEAG